MHFWLIYKTTCRPNGMIYVGQHKTLVEEDGYIGSGKLIRRAIEKYGIEQFDRVILQRCNTREEANAAEEHWIETLHSYDRSVGYNITKLAWGGQPITPETRAKISASSKGKKLSEEHRAKLCKPKPPRSAEHMESLLKSRGSVVWVHNPITNEATLMKVGDIMPDGWIRGRGKSQKADRKRCAYDDNWREKVSTANQSIEKRLRVAASVKLVHERKRNEKTGYASPSNGDSTY